MSSEPPAIRVEGLGKEYRLGSARVKYRTLRETVTNGAARITRIVRGRSASGAAAAERMWALRDVTFSIPRGRAVGIVGHNGAGKSTLLKVLSRITEPTLGRAEIRGRIGSLLEIGTGFHNELTGRENIFLSGAILGMRRAEIADRFDQIVEFAEIARFIETPVKHYSSGMYLRLAFAVAAHLDPEILLVDEVLAVGDAAFQKKCLGRMSDVTGDRGRTIIFVSHNMDAIQRLCSECLLLDHGRLVAYAPTRAVVEQYLATLESETPPLQPIDLSGAHHIGSGEARFMQASYTSFADDVACHAFTDGPLEFTFVIESDSVRTVSSMAVYFESITGTKLVDADTISTGTSLHLQRGRNVVRFRILELHLNPGTYVVGLWLAPPRGSGFDNIRAAFRVEVVPTTSHGFGVTRRAQGAVSCRFTVSQA
jgi:lipopolysaccharide transport system ATP-binding protein